MSGVLSAATISHNDLRDDLMASGVKRGGLMASGLKLDGLMASGLISGERFVGFLALDNLCLPGLPVWYLAWSSLAGDISPTEIYLQRRARFRADPTASNSAALDLISVARCDGGPVQVRAGDVLRPHLATLNGLIRACCSNAAAWYG